MPHMQTRNPNAKPAKVSDSLVYFEQENVRLRRIDYHAGETQSPHHHDFASVTLVMRGDCLESSEHDNHVSQACTVLIKPPHVSHANEYGDQGTLSLQIAFAPQAFPFFPLGHACRHFEGGAPATEMLALLRAAERMPEEELIPFVTRAVATVALACEQQPASSVPQWLADVADEIESASTDGVSVHRMAQAAGIHPVSLARAFRRHHACSITEFVRRKRIVQASRRIAAGAPSLADVAIESGFADQPHFTRAFRAELGCTPGEFKKLVV